MACAKHFIAYEQDHFRLVDDSIDWGFNITESMSSNLDDETVRHVISQYNTTVILIGIRCMSFTFGKSPKLFQKELLYGLHTIGLSRMVLGLALRQSCVPTTK